MRRLAQKTKSIRTMVVESMLPQLAELLQFRHMLAFLPGRTQRQLAQMSQSRKLRSHKHALAVLFDAKLSELRHVAQRRPAGRSKDGARFIQRLGTETEFDTEGEKTCGQHSAQFSRCILTRQSLHKMPNLSVGGQCELQRGQLR
jgi:hypothetical protein